VEREANAGTSSTAKTYIITKKVDDMQNHGNDTQATIKTILGLAK
jgi:hypothetical protein